ncbi:MAG TPA: zinc-dependent metalloprotease, partial [Gemmatimonadaceae bacterium]
RIEPNGSLTRINDAQARILSTLLNDWRMERMIEISSRGGDVYTLPDMLADVRHGIWSELADRKVAIDVYRRNLQRAYLDQLDAKINGAHGDAFTIVLTPSPAPGPQRRRPADTPAVLADARAAMRAELVALRAEIVAAIPRVADAATRMHLADSKLAIDRALDPNR